MAETITQEFYNGKEWIVVTSEILYDKQGNPTGHYKEISRDYVNKSGIFDDLIIQEEKIELINQYRNTRYNDYYVLKGADYLQFYRAYSYGGSQSIGHAVVDFIQKNQILVKSCEQVKEDANTYIEFICETRPNYDTFKMILIYADNYLVLVP